jgi:hypothetical protein
MADESKPETVIPVPSSFPSTVAGNEGQGMLGRLPLQVHPTEQHMITYSVGEDQFDFIGTSGTRFTIASTVTAFFGSATVACVLAGLTVPSPWNAPQIAAFVIAPIITGVLSAVSLFGAYHEHKLGVEQRDRIKARSYEPGTIVSIKQLRERRGS